MSGLVDPDSPAAIRRALEELGLALKKRWGQNFLVSPGARGRILSLLDAKPGEEIWEIGPGLGAMTAELLSAGVRLTAFEIDHGLCRYLTDAFSGEPGFRLVPGDFLRTWQEMRPLPARILGNLPYRSASLMIASLIEGGLVGASMVFTVQKELAERMAARPGTKSYSSFSVLCQTAMLTVGRGDIQAGSFYPAPEVVSSVVEMRPLPPEEAPADRALVSLVSRSLFRARRKTLRNNVAGSELCGRFPLDQVMEALEAEGISPARRAEELEPRVFVRIAARLTGAPGGPGRAVP
jgi:16S rRNA (adenine1518-N6/adenine1519-N6)-dimethyltransferase